LRAKGTDEDRHKGTEEQRDRADGFFCFVPLHLCHFVLFFLCAYVPLQLGAGILTSHSPSVKQAQDCGELYSIPANSTTTERGSAR
jgi:hypothetical protein